MHIHIIASGHWYCTMLSDQEFQSGARAHFVTFRGNPDDFPGNSVVEAPLVLIGIAVGGHALECPWNNRSR